jgi:hypothetical protein
VALVEPQLVLTVVQAALTLHSITSLRLAVGAVVLITEPRQLPAAPVAVAPTLMLSRPELPEQLARALPAELVQYGLEIQSLVAGAAAADLLV